MSWNPNLGYKRKVKILFLTVTIKQAIFTLFMITIVAFMVWMNDNMGIFWKIANSLFIGIGGFLLMMEKGEGYIIDYFIPTLLYLLLPDIYKRKNVNFKKSKISNIQNIKYKQQLYRESVIKELKGQSKDNEEGILLKVKSYFNKENISQYKENINFFIEKIKHKVKKK